MFRAQVPSRGAHGSEEAPMDCDTNIVGHFYDKYDTKNPIERKLTAGFLQAVSKLYEKVGPQTVLEVGCGEGILADYLLGKEPGVLMMHACDVSLDSVRPGLDDSISFGQASIYQLPYTDNSFELVLCCEVLEHLTLPPIGLYELCRVASRAVIVSTPWEPVWRLLNMVRGKYLQELGNTPGHIQHFTHRGLLRLIEGQLNILHVERPLPWTVVLAEPR